MASSLDGAGQIKLATLDEALVQWQRLHALVERYAMTVRAQGETGGFRQQLTRTATPLASLLKPQFGSVADLVTQFVLIASRGGSEQVRVRALREGAASIRAQLDIAVVKVKEKHAMPDASAPES